MKISGLTQSKYGSANDSGEQTLNPDDTPASNFVKTAH